MIELHKLAFAEPEPALLERKIPIKRPDQTERLMATIVNLVNGINFMVIIYCRLMQSLPSERPSEPAPVPSGAIAGDAHSSRKREIIYDLQ